MSGHAGLEFQDGDSAPIAARGAVIHTRGDVKGLSDALIAAFAANGVRRAMVRSDDPVHILRAVDAAGRAGVDLFIAHTNLPEAQVAEIAETQAVHYLIGETDAPRAAPEGEPSGGRIFMMTSGTTGKPKIAAHTLDSLLARVRAGRDAQAMKDGKWLLTYQPTSFAGVQVQLTAALTGGLIVSPEQRNPGGFHEAAKHWQVTQISATPTFWRAFLMVANPAELALKQITLGGEASDQATLDRIKAAFPNARVSHVYASTEAGVVFAVHDGREGFPAAWLDRDGQGVQVRIRDGFLQIKTAAAMKGYVTESAQPLLDDGWLGTADLCEIVGDRVRILGRQDSTINVAGSKVYPLAVEAVLLAQPGVVEARVYGVPNPVSGALVGADVVLAEGEDKDAARGRILAACREQLAGYQVPRVFKIVDAIESRASGKKG